MKHVVTCALLILALQGLPNAVIAASDDPPTTATLLAQASDPAVIAPTAAATNVAQAQPAEDIFTPEQLEQLVAPIALYPDALLMQILMASTYPLEIVEADRWLGKQPDLKGDALDKALLEKDWDPSVKSLTTLPSVLKQMSENLDWTQDLGDAFLAQENALLDTVQIMRGKAYEAGNLKSTEQQQVTQNPDKIIVIQQSSPEIVYVPTYSPTVVYGPTWGYPSYYYPAMYPYYPPGYGLMAFGVGVAVGAAIWGNCNWGWGNNNVNIDIDRHNEFNRNTNNNFNGDRGNRGQGDRGQGNRGQGGKEGWKHDASHRKGVDYKSKDVAQRNGASAGSNRVTKDQARGRAPTAGTSDRAGAGGQAQNRAGAGGQAQNRAGAGGQTQNRSAGAGGQAQNRSAGAGAQAQNRSAGSQGTRDSSANRSQSAGSSAYKQSGSSGANRSGSSGGNSAFSGSRTPSSDRMSSSRGASSRGTSSYGGSRGGGGGGGGGSRGGGGRRR